MGESQLPGGVVTFVFTDVEGSTRLLRRLRDAYPAVLERHFALLREVWAAHGGHEVSVHGDGSFVAFAEAPAAIAACVDAQARLAAATWPGDTAVRVRMGIHAGLAVPRGDDYVALAVHQAARVAAAANGAQVLVSDRAAAQGAVPPDVELLPMGRFRLRDFDDPPRLFSAGGRGVAADATAPRAVPVDGHNVVRPPTPFFGREAEVRDVTSMLRAGRVVTLTGPGGVGKTRLASEVGVAVAGAWTDGVWFVDLAPLRDIDLIGAAVADAVGVRGRDRVAGWRDALDHIRGHHALVILDNCEHVLDAAATVADELLAVCPEVGVLATSREALGVAGETVVAVAPLAVPREGAARAAALHEPAVALFVDRAAAARPAWVLGDDDVARVVEICRRLDGLPLAVELAAAQTSVLSLTELLAGLDDGLRVLRGRDRRPDRQRTMEAVLDWSRRLLTPDEQVALRRLGVFRSGFTLETAAAAVAGDGIDRFEVPDLVWALADKSLVVVDRTADETRYRLLETVRAYASRLLEDEDDPALVAGRLAAWWLGDVGPAQPIDRKRTGRLAVELDNLLGLVERLTGHDDATAQQLAASVARYYYAVDTLHDSVEQLERFASTLPTPSHALVSLLSTLAHLHVRRGEVEAARRVLERAARAEEEAGPPPWDLAAVDRVQGEVALRAGDPAGAIRIATAALERDLDARARARMLNLLGVASHFLGDATSGDAAFAEELRIAGDLGDEHLLAVAEGNLAESALRRGDRPEAARHQLACLRLGLALGAPAPTAYSLIAAARLVAADEPAVAVRLHGKADDVLCDCGHTPYDDDVRASEEMLRAARSVLGATAFDDADREGRAASLPDAAATAEAVLARLAGAS